MKKLKKVAAISIVTMCFLNNIVLAETILFKNHIVTIDIAATFFNFFINKKPL